MGGTWRAAALTCPSSNPPHLERGHQDTSYTYKLSQPDIYATHIASNALMLIAVLLINLNNLGV